MIFSAHFSKEPEEIARIKSLAGNSLKLIGLTIGFTLVPAILFAVALERYLLRIRTLGLFFLLLLLLIPLPALVSAWQMAIGPQGIIRTAVPEFGQPIPMWSSSLFAAALVHALAALPWIVWLLVFALRQVEREMEEDALLNTTPLRVIFQVSLRRITPALWFATLWIIVQCLGEIAVTEVMQIHTIAEEVYTQFVLAPEALPNLLLLALPQTVFCFLSTLYLLHRWQNRGGIADLRQSRSELLYRPLLLTWSIGIIVVSAIVIIVILPLGSLLWRCGADDHSHWHWYRFSQSLVTVYHSENRSLWLSLLESFAAGCFAVLISLIASYLSLRSTSFRNLLFLTTMLLWCLPGPVLGLALKNWINILMDFEDWLGFFSNTAKPLQNLLYTTPNPFPNGWIHCLRSFPLAMMIVWPALQRIPPEYRDILSLDTNSIWSEWVYILWPQMGRSLVIAIFLTMQYSLGEIAASKMVEIPGAMTFIHRLFQQMHYGTGSTVAASCLLQLAITMIFLIITMLVVSFLVPNQNRLTPIEPRSSS